MRRIYRFLFRVALALLLLSVGSVLLFRYVPVPVTPLMVRNALGAAIKGEPTTFHHDWVPMEAMSPHLEMPWWPVRTNGSMNTTDSIGRR